MRVVILIPTYNEKENILRFLQSIATLRAQDKKHSYHVLVVDDQSPDGTGTLVLQFKKKYPWVQLLSGEPQGIGKAMIRGYQYILRHIPCDCVVSIDADFVVDPSNISAIVAPITKGMDAVFARRAGDGIEGQGILRRYLHKFVNTILAQRILNISGVSDYTACFRAIRVNSVLSKLDWNHIGQYGYVFFPALAVEISKYTHNISELEFVFKARTSGSSKISLRAENISNILANTKEYLGFYLTHFLHKKNRIRFSFWSGLCVVSLILNVVLWLGISQLSNKQLQNAGYTPSQGRYAYLSPRIFSENQNDLLVNFVKLREKLQTVTKEMTGLGIYFEYLPSGVSIGIREKDSYVLASLLKTPMMMAVFKQIESGKWHYDDILTIEKQDLDPYFGEVYKRGAGTQISLKEAIRETLVNSDNTTKSVLFNHLPDGAVDDVFDYLDIPKQREGILPVVTPKNYSSILRSLYLSSYLEKEYSNEILDLLTHSPFNDKLSAPIPSDIPVAHKIGIYGKDNPKASVFTDCGIIYVPKRPYILCLMDRSPEEQARADMKHVSEIIYEYVRTINTE